MATVTRNKVQIRTDEKPITFTTIELGNMSKDQAEILGQFLFMLATAI